MNDSKDNSTFLPSSVNIGLTTSKAAPLAAAEGDQLVVAAVTATQPQEAVGQDAAFDEGVELVLDELRKVGSSSGLRCSK